MFVIEIEDTRGEGALALHAALTTAGYEVGTIRSKPKLAPLTLAQLRESNVARLPEFRDAKGNLAHPVEPGRPIGFDWLPSQWSNATLGELGELANIIKKLERGDFALDETVTISGKTQTAQAHMADELCDVLTYLDLLAYRLRIDLGEALRAKWNQVSLRVKSETRLPLGSEWAPTDPDPDCGTCGGKGLVNRAGSHLSACGCRALDRRFLPPVDEDAAELPPGRHTAELDWREPEFPWDEGWSEDPPVGVQVFVVAHGKVQRATRISEDGSEPYWQLADTDHEHRDSVQKWAPIPFSEDRPEFYTEVTP